MVARQRRLPGDVVPLLLLQPQHEILDGTQPVLKRDLEPLLAGKSAPDGNESRSFAGLERLGRDMPLALRHIPSSHDHRIVQVDPLMQGFTLDPRGARTNAVLVW